MSDNTERIIKAQAMLDSNFDSDDDDDLDSMIIDTITNMLHLANHHGMNIEVLLAAARINFDEEM